MRPAKVAFSAAHQLRPRGPWGLASPAAADGRRRLAGSAGVASAAASASAQPKTLADWVESRGGKASDVEIANLQGQDGGSGLSLVSKVDAPPGELRARAMLPVIRMQPGDWLERVADCGFHDGDAWAWGSMSMQPDRKQRPCWLKLQPELQP